MAHDVTLILGDGVGPELAAAAKACIDATGAAVRWDEQAAGADCLARSGSPLPESLMASLRRTRVALKAPITTPVGGGFRSVNVHLRQAFHLYACLRPCKSYPGVRSRYTDIDLVVVRENTEDLYAGVEFARGTNAARELVAMINRLSDDKTIRTSDRTTGLSIKPISVEATERIHQFAFRYARQYGRKKITTVHKANIMKHTDGLWLEVARDVAKQYPDVEFEDRIVDNMCMQLVQKPNSTTSSCCRTSTATS